MGQKMKTTAVADFRKTGPLLRQGEKIQERNLPAYLKHTF